jgi:aminomethyltransferase
MSTNHVQGLKPGQGCYTFFLNAQGRILADANLLVFDDHILIDTEPELRAPLLEHLDRYIIADDVTLEDQTSQNVTIGIEGPRAGETLGQLGAPIPEEPYGWSAWGKGMVARIDTTGGGGFFAILPSAERAELTGKLAAAQVPEASPEDLRTVRIENGRPRFGDEITDRYLVQETGQMQAIHFSKGCYLGQEIVERVRSRGQVHRVLRRVEIESERPPESGAKLTSGGSPAGEIASAVFSPALGKTAALAYVRSQYAEPNQQLQLDGAGVSVK